MMSCKIFASTTAHHVSQIYTGFYLMAAQGDIGLTQSFDHYRHEGKVPGKDLERRNVAGLFVVIDGRKIVFYDMRDDGSIFFDEALTLADAYFKRSYLESAVPADFRHKVFPLGLNYSVHPDGLDRYELARAVYGNAGNKPLGFAKEMAHYFGIGFKPTLTRMSSWPQLKLEPKVLFMVAAWDPKDAVSEEKRQQRILINDMRANVIRRLRSELGSRFCGGFSHTPHATRHYGDLLIQDGRLSRKKAYMALVRQHPICIATTGLHESIGGKMAEYVALSRAIVSEKLHYVVPHGFNSPANYLEFDSPDGCVEHAMRLVEAKDVRCRMMEENWRYYQTSLRPDKLVGKTLAIASAL